VTQVYRGGTSGLLHIDLLSRPGTGQRARLSIEPKDILNILMAAFEAKKAPRAVEQRMTPEQLRQLDELLGNLPDEMAEARELRRKLQGDNPFPIIG
jgi:hypothetical protein